MDVSEIVIANALSRQKETKDLIKQGSSEVQKFYNGVTVFLTGGSGFLGKQLIEKLLRTCKIKRIYMLLRPKRGKPVGERVAEIFEDELYETLREEQPIFMEKIVAIEGDVAAVDLGISDEDRQNIIEEVDVIFHIAASISFQAPLRSATFTNVRGTRDLLKLAKQSKNIRSFIYMSTAYSHATFSRRNTEVLEEIYSTPLSPHFMIRIAETLDEDRINGITDGLIKDWPNTYSFTKALAENLIASSANDLPVRIIRPSIVISARREPYAGWIDKSCVVGPNGMTAGSMMGVIHVLHSTQDIRVDFVPIDYVTNTAIVAAATATDGVQVYTVGTSCRNHITWGGLSHILNTVARKTVVSPKAIWYCFVVQSPNIWVYKIFSFLLHTVPANIVDGVCVVIGRPPRLKKIYSTIAKMGAVVSFYTNNSWIFNDKNTSKLFKNLSVADRTIFFFDVMEINWVDYIVLWCVGMRKYVIKDGLKNTEKAMKMQFWYQMCTYFLSVFMFVVLSVFMYDFFAFLLCFFNL